MRWWLARNDRTRTPDEGSDTLGGPLRRRAASAGKSPGPVRDQMGASTLERWAERQRMIDDGACSTPSELPATVAGDPCWAEFGPSLLPTSYTPDTRRL
jgi:hypothetical protein